MMVEEIIKTLKEFAPFHEDDPDNDNVTFLYDLMEAWKTTDNKNLAIPTIFQLIERFPRADFGSPGPLVHALESTKQYENELQLSLLRKPTPLTLWMFNRIMNVEVDRRILNAHIEQMKLLVSHPLVDVETKKVAEDFLVFQEERP